MITDDLFAGNLPKPLPSRTASTATEAQLGRLLDYLQRRPCSTHELRHAGISHPAGRVHDLIRRGYTVTTSRIVTVDSDGFTHKNVALYWLLAEPESRVAK